MSVPDFSTSFESHSLADLLSPLSPDASKVAENPRTGTYSMKVVQGGSASPSTRTLEHSYRGFVGRFAFRYSALPTTRVAFHRVLTSITTGKAAEPRFELDTNGKLYFAIGIGAGSISQGTSTLTTAPATIYVVDYNIDLSGTVLSSLFYLKFQITPEGSATVGGDNIVESLSAPVDMTAVRWNDGVSGLTWWFDDWQYRESDMTAPTSGGTVYPIGDNAETTVVPMPVSESGTNSATASFPFDVAFSDAGTVVAVVVTTGTSPELDTEDEGFETAVATFSGVEEAFTPPLSDSGTAIAGASQTGIGYRDPTEEVGTAAAAAVQEADLVTVVGTLDNRSPYEVYPVTVVHGYAIGPYIGNRTNDESLRWYDAEVPADKEMVIDHAAGRATIDGKSVEGDMPRASKFWALSPGDNEVEAGAKRYGAGFRVEVRHTRPR